MDGTAFPFLSAGSRLLSSLPPTLTPRPNGFALPRQPTNELRWVVQRSQKQLSCNWPIPFWTHRQRIHSRLNRCTEFFLHKLSADYLTKTIWCAADGGTHERQPKPLSWRPALPAHPQPSHCPAERAVAAPYLALVRMSAPILLLKLWCSCTPVRYASMSKASIPVSEQYPYPVGRGPLHRFVDTRQGPRRTTFSEITRARFTHWEIGIGRSHGRSETTTCLVLSEFSTDTHMLSQVKHSGSRTRKSP